MMNQKQPQRTEKSSVNHDSIHRSPFTTDAQRSFRRNGWKRLSGAMAVALASVAAFIIFGPKEDDIKERFEYYGARDEIRIMSEISIDDGRDNVEKIPKSLQIPPPPAKLEIEEDVLDPDGTEIIAEEKEADANRIDVNTRNPIEDSVTSEEYQVEMSLPRQTNTDFYIIHMVRPDYPLNATELERRTPVIVVKMNLFVNPQGSVTEVMIQSSNGNKAFEEAAIAAVREWKFGWLVEPGAGRWLQFPFNFKSPYFTPDR